MPTTSYFSKDSLSFLRELRAHNDKVWFDENRERFEASLKEPALRLIADLDSVLKKISRHFVADARANGGSLSRMNRDIRFSKDKRPYKTALFVHFKHAKASDEAAPSFYMHIEPGASTVGGGVWQPGSKALKSIRDAIASGSAWGKVTSAGVNGACLMSSGESLKRVPSGYDADHRFAEDLKRKDFGTHQPLSDASLVSAKLRDDLADRLAAAAPLLRFVCKAVDLPF